MHMCIYPGEYFVAHKNIFKLTNLFIDTYGVSLCNADQQSGNLFGLLVEDVDVLPSTNQALHKLNLLSMQNNPGTCKFYISSFIVYILPIDKAVCIGNHMYLCAIKE